MVLNHNLTFPNRNEKSMVGKLGERSLIPLSAGEYV